MTDYCRNHRSYFCPCVKAYLYGLPFAAQKDLRPLPEHRDEWGRTEREYQERQLERRFRKQ